MNSKVISIEQLRTLIPETKFIHVLPFKNPKGRIPYYTGKIGSIYEYDQIHKCVLKLSIVELNSRIVPTNDPVTPYRSDFMIWVEESDEIESLLVEKVNEIPTII